MYPRRLVLGEQQEKRQAYFGNFLKVNISNLPTFLNGQIVFNPRVYKFYPQAKRDDIKECEHVELIV
jgi:hypothetical protein